MCFIVNGYERERWGFPGSSDGKESTCNTGDPDLIPGWGRFPGEGIGYPLQYFYTPLVLRLQRICCSVGDLGSIPGLGRAPGGGTGNPVQHSCLKNHHRQRILGGYSPGGHKAGHDERRSTSHERQRQYFPVGQKADMSAFQKNKDVSLGGKVGARLSATPQKLGFSTLSCGMTTECTGRSRLLHTVPMGFYRQREPVQTEFLLPALPWMTPMSLILGSCVFLQHPWSSRRLN